MIRGLISEGMPCVPIATDGEIWYTLLASDQTVAFGSLARNIPSNLTRCVVIHKFNGGNNFEFARKTVIFPNSASEASYNDFGTFTMMPDNVNLPEEGLFAGVSYLPNKAFDCFAATDIPAPNCDVSSPEFSFRGVDTNVDLVKKELRITFVPYSTALSKFNEGSCFAVQARDQLFYDFINGIDNLGDYLGDLKLPRNCNVYSNESRGCYNIGVSCYAINYCAPGTYCDSGKCYGKTKLNHETQCVIGDNGVSVVARNPSTDSHQIADDGGEVDSGPGESESTKKKALNIISILSIIGVLIIVFGTMFVIGLWKR